MRWCDWPIRKEVCPFWKNAEAETLNKIFTHIFTRKMICEQFSKRIVRGSAPMFLKAEEKTWNWAIRVELWRFGVFSRACGWWHVFPPYMSIADDWATRIKPEINQFSLAPMQSGYCDETDLLSSIQKCLGYKSFISLNRGCARARAHTYTHTHAQTYSHHVKVS